MGCRTGYKDINGKCVMEYLPGLAAKLTGTDIPEYSFAAPDEGPITVEWEGAKFEAAVFNDLLAPMGENAQVVGTYISGPYAGTPALIRNRFGKGEAYYFGGAFAEDTVRVFLEKLGAAESYGEILSLPEGCELALREKEGRRYLFVLNYMAEPAEIHIHTKLYNLLEQKEQTGRQILEKYGVRIFSF